MGENLISRVKLDINSNLQFSTKKIRCIKKQESMSHSKEKNKPADTVSEKALVAYLIDRYFKTTVLKILRGLKIGESQENEV